MAESWIAQRERTARGLEERLRASGNRADSIVWERYVRKTARMQATAAGLAQHLPAPDCRVEHGLSVRSQGEEIYLEHVVTTPRGIYLIESYEAEDPQWRRDLVKNIGFFQEILGIHARYFTCLVIHPGSMPERLPQGAHLVESLDVALDVMNDPGRLAETVSPHVLTDMWYTLSSLRSYDEVQPPPPSRWKRAGRLGQSIILLSAVVGVTIAALDPQGTFGAALFAAIVMVIAPSFLVVFWATSRQSQTSRYLILGGWLVWLLLMAMAVLGGPAQQA